jgi:DNA polymerase III epsilon subunit-like protein
MPKATGDDSNSFDCIAPLKADGSHFKYPNKAMYGKLYKIENEKYVDVDASSISDSDWNKESGAWKNYYYATNASADEPAYEALWDKDHSCFNYLAVPGGVFEKTETTEYRKIYTFADVKAYADADNLYNIGYSVVEGGVPTSEWNNNWQNYYGYGNKCEYMPDAECFEVVGDWMSHLYTPSDTVDGKTVGFKMVNNKKEISIKSTDYTVTTVNGENIVTLTKYVKDKVPTNWDKDYSRYLVRTCSYEDGKIEGVVLNSLNTVCPDFKAGEVFSATASAGMFEDIGGSSSVPENWETTYTNYYSSTGLQVGLLENSYEMQQWKAGSLKLYVPEMSFTVPANTEYQLKSGDYLSFFWREQDNDDAPYNYVKYDDVYDKETGAPTIIKASFTINASPISECLINPQKLTSATGKIYTNDTLFNILKEKFYGEYDLSGTKKIEMRKMNAVKMNNKDNKYFYFIIRDKDEEEDTQSDENQYKLVLNRVGVRNNNYVKYTYTLENDEYFIYTNSSKTGFEALGAGTLIEYYEYFDREIPTDEKKVFYAPIIDAQKIAYSGIDAFVDSCDEVRGKNTFSLVEQQIYSFTNGDSVHIQLNDDYDYSFVEVENPDRDADLGQNNFYIDGSEFCKVELLTDADTNTKAPPPYIKDYYYIGTSDANGTFYTLIESLPICAPVFRSGTYYATDDGSSTPESKIPDGWETVYKNYFVMNNHKYTRVEGVSCWNKEYFEQNDIYIKSGYNFELITDKQTYQEYVDNGTPIYEKQAPNYPQYNGTPSPVYNYSVSYATNNSSGETNASSGFEMLPQILVTNEDYCWRASSHLNLSSAENKPQKIENATGNSVQSVTIGGVNFPEHGTYTNEEGKTVYRFDKNNPLYLVTEINIDKVGGSDVDVSWVDMMNNRHPIDVFVYQLNPAFNNSNGWSYLDDGTIRLIAKGDGTTTTKVIEGIHLDREFKYILPITLYANDDTTKNSYIAPTISVVATLDNGTTTTLECVCHKHTSLKPDTHFVLLPSNAVALTVTVNGGSGKEDVSAKFGYLFKYVHREMFDGGGKYSKSKYDVTTDELIEELRRLDVPKVFDYTHMPDKSICIDDPLSAYSFFEPRHVFNSVTIPRAELRFTNQMGTEVPFDSSITFVNNR